MDGNRNNEANRLSGLLSSLLLHSLDDAAGTDELARKAYRSRSDFYRLFQALIDESPGAMRRRVLLERAAWRLCGTRETVTEIALDAQFGSLEGFSRAFRKAFGISPSLFRRSGSTRFHLPCRNEYHFCPPVVSNQETGKPVSALKERSYKMDLFALFAGTDSWYTRRLLEQAMKLSDEQLNRPLPFTAKVFPWDKPDENLREILERMVQTTEVWTAALTGGEMPDLDGRPPEDRTPGALLTRFGQADADFQRILEDVDRRGAWDETFVDALCEPAETFTYGGMFAHVITFNAHRRLTALDAFQRLGVSVSGSGCPSEYEAAMGKGEHAVARDGE